eukprot:10058661-Alexandrium_andersonii.AAC.1
MSASLVGSEMCIRDSIAGCTPTITPAMVRQAMLTFSTKKAAGSDYLTMEVLRALPPTLIVELA